MFASKPSMNPRPFWLLLSKQSRAARSFPSRAACKACPQRRSSCLNSGLWLGSYICIYHIIRGGKCIYREGAKAIQYPLMQTSSHVWSMRSTMTKKASMSKRLTVWALPPSYDLENLHGIHGPLTPIAPSSHGATSPSTLRQ